MNQGPPIFLGVFAALTASWFGMIVQPQLQLGRATPGTNILNTAELYPQARSGQAQRGLQVYRSLGCSECHTQQVRQEGALFDVILTKPGTNTAEVVEKVHQLRNIPTPEAGRLISTLPATVLSGMADKLAADAAAKALETNGAKAEVHMLALGADMERGWGRARTVAADFLLDAVVMPGSLRLGPDLANVGARQRSAEWHYRHLIDPKSLEPKSVMPAYRFLFETTKVRAGSPLPPDALVPTGTDIRSVIAGSRTNWVSLTGSGPVSATDVDVPVPTDDARALVAYLLSLKTDVALLERPLAAAPASATNAVAALAPPTNNVTDGATNSGNR